MIEKRSLTPAQVARRLQVSEARVVSWLRLGQLHGLRLGDQWRTSAPSLAAFLEARANRPAVGPGGSAAEGRRRALGRRDRA